MKVRRGEIFTFLGPNEAGKTTTVEILEGHRKRTGGNVRVLGEDPQHADRRWRAQVGVVLQASRVEQELTVRECCGARHHALASDPEHWSDLAHPPLREGLSQSRSSATEQGTTPP